MPENGSPPKNLKDAAGRIAKFTSFIFKNSLVLAVENNELLGFGYGAEGDLPWKLVESLADGLVHGAETEGKGALSGRWRAYELPGQGWLLVQPSSMEPPPGWGPFWRQHFASLMATGRARESADRILGMQKLLADLEQPVTSLQRLAENLREQMAAAALTILLVNGSRLRLSATTDPQLQKKAYFQEVYYERPQNQLTSWVWREGLSLRLSLVDDAAAIYKKTGMLRSCAQHPEFGASGEEGVQFLAVPIRHREEVLGVIRCSRVREQVGFTPDDEQALVSFSELLALVVRTTREGKVAAALEQASGAAVALTHGEGHRERVTWINQHGRSLTRNPQEDPVGKPLAEVFDRRLPEYWDIRGTPVEVPLAEDRWYELTVQTLNDPLFLPPRKMNLGIARDITERKRATRTLENMRRVMEGLGFAWFDVGMDGRIREVSENESRILGYSREELLALPRKELWYEKEDRAAMLREAEYAGGQLQKLVWLKHKNKHKVGVEAFVRLGPHTPGQEPELAGFYLDVTERLRLQRGLELEDDQILDYTKMANQLRLREQRQLDYLSAVTHQLKAPVHGLLQSAVTIKGEAHRYAPKAIPELDQAVGLARLALGLLENLSYMDRLLGGEDLLSHAARIHLGEVVQDVRGIFTALARVKNLQMEVDAVAWNAQDRRLWGDRGLIAQLVFNLIHNALRYARADTTVRVYGGEEKGRIFLTVADVGLRIPPDQRERVFDRGYRTSKARAMDPSGTGLGLWLVRRICDLHRAEIKCEEEEYHEQIWTVFRVWFPPAGAGGGRPGLRDEATLGVDPGPGL